MKYTPKLHKVYDVKIAVNNWLEFKVSMGDAAAVAWAEAIEEWVKLYPETKLYAQYKEGKRYYTFYQNRYSLKDFIKAAKYFARQRKIKLKVEVYSSKLATFYYNNLLW